jgi:ATP-dependent helicase HrpB
MQPLPINAYLGEINHAVARYAGTIVEAAPGSGKTTRVAPAILQLGDFRGKVFLLQPRRVAVRAAAERIAAEQGWVCGDTVGYQVRFDNRTSESTRLIVATEGILLRRLQNDPLLEGTDVVVFDEFHERSLNSDLLLGMIRRIQTTLRPELRIVIMSATLGDNRLLDFFTEDTLVNAKQISVPGSMHDVKIKHRAAVGATRLVEHVADTILKTVQQGEPDILVFLPGVGEINAVHRQIQNISQNQGWEIYPLHGQMPLNQQVAALRPGRAPRVVLATNVAETSLTIEGIRTVIDSGMARVARFDPSIGLDRLSLEPISQASATQRAGRAGRITTGTCIRLWNSAADRSRANQLDPEIRRVDVAGAALQLFQWGEADAKDFPWLDPPRDDAWQTALDLLRLLGAVDEQGLTGIGRQMSLLPLSPRLARLMVEGYWLGIAETAARTAALLSERDPFIRPRLDDRRPTRRLERGLSERHDDGDMANRDASPFESDVLLRLNAFQAYDHDGETETAFGEIHRDSARNIHRVAKQLVATTFSALGDPEDNATPSDEALLRALLAAFPDRLAKRRAIAKPSALMVGGRGVTLDPKSSVRSAELFLCVETFTRGTDVRVTQASAVDPSWLPSRLTKVSKDLFFHPTQSAVVARERTRFVDLVLSEKPTEVNDSAAAADVLFNALQHRLSEIVPTDNRELNSFIERTKFLAVHLPGGFPACDEQQLRETLRQLSMNCRSTRDVRSADWLVWLRGTYSHDQLATLDRDAPARIEVPSGSKIMLEYDGDKPPVLAAKIQELFSLMETPRVAGGAVAVLVHLLAPNMRPQQVTDDLASFWKNTYPTVRKELKRRYSKHAWPEDPYTAQPIRK